MERPGQQRQKMKKSDVKGTLKRMFNRRREKRQGNVRLAEETVTNSVKEEAELKKKQSSTMADGGITLGGRVVQFDEAIGGASRKLQRFGDTLDQFLGAVDNAGRRLNLFDGSRSSTCVGRVTDESCRQRRDDTFDDLTPSTVSDTTADSTGCFTLFSRTNSEEVEERLFAEEERWLAGMVDKFLLKSARQRSDAIRGLFEILRAIASGQDKQREGKTAEEEVEPNLKRRQQLQQQLEEEKSLWNSSWGSSPLTPPSLPAIRPSSFCSSSRSTSSLATVQKKSATVQKKSDAVVRTKKTLSAGRSFRIEITVSHA